MTHKITPRDWEALSAYLDEEIAPKERAHLEARMKDDQALSAALEELRRTRVVLRSQPRRRAPRNFTLTPQMAGIRLGRLPAPRVYSTLRLASALATIFFLIVLVGDLVGNRAHPAEVAQAPGASMPGFGGGVGGSGGGGGGEGGIQNIASPLQAPAPTEAGIAAKAAESGTQATQSTVLEVTPGGPLPIASPTPPAVSLVAPAIRATEAPVEVEGAADQAQTTSMPETVHAPVSLPMLQVLLALLGLIAISTGLAAVILRIRQS